MNTAKSPFSENLRYLLWRHGIQRSIWPKQVTAWIRCSQQRATELLDNGEIQADEQAQIVQALGLTETDLQSIRLIELHRIDILLENLRFLFERLEHGEKKRLAAYLSVHPLTLSRWRSSEQRPSRQHLATMIRYFGLPDGINLETEPIFLARSPISVRDQRAWLRTQIEAMDPATLRTLFPALERLLAGS